MTKLRPSGGYRTTASFQTATLVYDATWWFCEKFLDPRSRTVDQMVQAARSGRQNIAEGSRAAATSSQTELRLINVARASLEELLLDFEDFLRHRRLPQWPPDSREARAIRDIPRNFRQNQPNQSDPPSSLDPSDLSNPSNPPDLTALSDQQRWALYAPWLEHDQPATRANAIICLIHKTNFLLDRQIAALEKAFIEGGGYSEQLATARLAERERRRHSNQPSQTDRTDPPDPSYLSSRPGRPTTTQAQIPPCPQCGKPMVLRTAKKGRNEGKQFWGCTAYPDCKEIQEN
jgi:restriction system protein